MDKLKKLRAPIRAAFTKTANAIEEILKEKEINIDQLQALGDVLDKKTESLVQLDQKIMDSMVEEDLPEEQISEEYEKASEYEEKMCFYRRRIESLMARLKPIASDTSSDVFGTVVSRQKKEKKYKLPKIEFTKFGGDLKEWLAFWAQFQKIHKDEDMADEDKFHYLRQSTEEGTKAREVVDSFPMTAENYPKVVKHLKERFGNKDMLIEYYVRELLRLVLSNALNQSKKMSISSLYDKLETQLRALESLNVTRNEFVAILYPLVESCLPEDILRAWERHRFLPLNREETDRLSRLMLFVKSEVESEERISMARGGFGDQTKKVPKKEDKYEIPSAAGLIVGSSDDRKREVCIFCGKKSHFSRKCWKGAKMSLAEKQKTCKEEKVCFTCLNRGHITPNCPNKDRLKCETCEGQHCYMMCPDNARKGTEKTNVGLSQSIELVQASPTTNLLLKQRKEESVLSTLLIRIHNGNRSIVVRAAIDSGSHKTYLLKRVIRELGLEKIGQETLVHELFGGHQLKETVHGRYRILAENLDGSYACEFDALEQERICFDVKRIIQGNWLQKLQEENIILTDVGVGSAEIELLIGNNVAGRLLHKIHRLKEYENFVAMDYSLGWTIMGTVPTNTSNDHTDTALLVHTPFIREANVSDLWRLDLIGIEDAAETKKKETNLRAITEQFQKNLKINDEGRYEISLPFIKGSPPLKSNRKIAEQRLITMSRKLSPELKESYCKVFEDWEMNGVIEQVPDDQLENGAYYMPHKPVLNPSSLTTPVRPVFDASAKEKGEQRLITMSRKLSPELKESYCKVFEDWEMNGVIEQVPDDQLENGAYYMPHKPVLNPSSLTTPVRPVFDASAKEKGSLSLNDSLEKGPNLLEVITSIMIRFRLWRHGVLSDIKKAFLQISIQPKDRDFLRLLWWEKKSNKIKIFRHRRLVFGLTCSSFTLAAIINKILEEAPKQYEETAKQLKESNYVDNCITSVETEEEVFKFEHEATYLLSTRQFELRGWEWNAPTYQGDTTKEISVLGLTWNLALDTLSCDIDKGSDLGDQEITKQIILSTTHKIFDPIGFTTPLVVYPKVLLQECWKTEIGWKDPVPELMARKFRKWCKQLANVKEITIPRWIGLSKVNVNSVQLHVFADASQSAYNATIFMRIDEGSHVKVQLIQSKTRIAPLKKLSINRLELLGCTIAARLATNTKNDLSIGEINCVYCTDSANSLHWIQHDDQWGIYVWNRVEEIKKLTPITAWRHIPGTQNPADLPSRGCSASQLVKSSWWEGPDWLRLSEEDWPKSNAKPDESVINSERKKVVIANWERAKKRTNTSWLTSFQLDYEEMIRFVALMKRLVRNCKSTRQQRITGNISVEELNSAENHIIYSIQNEAFMVNDPMLNSMELVQDSDGVLRVRTKLLLREDKSTFKTPAVLPSKHPIVKAIIKFCHKDNLHAGTLTLMSLLREKFWIIRARSTIKKIVKECFVCNWYNAKPFTTPPAQLPIDRITEAATFEVTGVDLTGHLFLEDGSKVWVVLYTCAVYRAISLDLVTSLSTDAFMQSLRRFIANYGRPRKVFCDHGTNLKGTDNQLKEIDWELVQKSAVTKKIDWTFIPSKAPWWGGWWERLVGVVKGLLKRVLGKSNLNFDEIRTILCEVAAIVNSRPLTYMANESAELETLSPSMFLKDLKQEGTADLDSVNAKKFNERHQYRVKLKTELQTRFRSEYMGQLVHRKGAHATRSIEIGELVLIVNENQKRTLWPIAKVVELIPSKDGYIRVAMVKTAKGILERPVKLLVPLEVRENEDISILGIPEKYKGEIAQIQQSVNGSKKKKKKSKSKIKETNNPTVTMEQMEKPEKTTRSGRVVKTVNRFGG